MGKNSREAEGLVEGGRVAGLPEDARMRTRTLISHTAQRTRLVLLPAESHPLFSFCGAKNAEDSLAPERKIQPGIKRRRCN